MKISKLCEISSSRIFMAILLKFRKNFYVYLLRKSFLKFEVIPEQFQFFIEIYIPVQGVVFYLIKLIFQALNAYSLFKVYILMFLAKIKGNKVHFWKLVTFFGKGGSIYPLPTPQTPQKCLQGVTCSKIFQEGGSAQILSLREGVRPPRTPLRTSMLLPLKFNLLKKDLKDNCN